MPPKRTRIARIGWVEIGGGNPVAVQSMTNTRTADVESTVEQILHLADAGCEIVRVAVPDKAAASVLPAIIEKSSLPVVADIHFKQELAFAALDAGVAKLRVNPGNLGGRRERDGIFRRLVKTAADRGAAIRIGVNSGSLEKELLEKYKHPTPEALVESALRWLERAEFAGGLDLVLSIKSSDVRITVEANRKLAAACDYPLHIGVTEAGPAPYGTIKSACGLAPLLLEGRGDTIRVSLTGDPVAEVHAAYDILQAVGRRVTRPEVVACPTCGRIEVNLEKLVCEVEAGLESRGITAPVRISVLGCAVNGPGEAREANVGVAAGSGKGIIFRDGRALRTVPEAEIVSALLDEVEKFIKDGGVIRRF